MSNTLRLNRSETREYRRNRTAGLASLIVGMVFAFALISVALGGGMGSKLAVYAAVLSVTSLSVSLLYFRICVGVTRKARARLAETPRVIVSGGSGKFRGEMPSDRTPTHALRSALPADQAA